MEEREAYYYHAFLKEQPDLNYRNPDVRRDMEVRFLNSVGGTVPVKLLNHEKH